MALPVLCCRSVPIHRLILLLLAAGLLAGPGPSRGQEPITRIAEVRALPRDETAQARPVQLRGVVTWVGRSSFNFQDDSAGGYVNVTLARKRGLWQGDEAALARVRPGTVVEVKGVTDRGGFAPPILPRTLRVVGEQPLPAARPAVPGRFFSGVDTGQRMEVRGVVQGFRTEAGVTTLILNANPGPFLARVFEQAFPDPEVLVDAEVRLTGPLQARFNTRGEFMVPVVALNGADDVVVEKPAPSGPFEASKVPLTDLARFRTVPLDAHRLRVEATVIYAASDGLLFVQDGLTGVQARVRRTASGLEGARVQVGDRVELAGFVDETREIRGLAEAVMRRIGQSSVPTPVSIEPEEILAVNTRSAATGLIAQPGDFDGRLIHFEARLVDFLDTVAGRRRILLATKASTIVATLADEAHVLDALRPGSRLAVTGIALLTHDSGISLRGQSVPNGVGLLLRDREDLVVLEAPSWWTRSRVVIALASVGVALVAAVLWVWLLHRQVQAQATQIAEEMRVRREGLVEFQATLRERNRLAANLHDTLLQTVGGIGYQLDACQVGTAQGEAVRASHLEVARRMVDHAVGELRGAVWALRALPMHGRAFPEALREMARHVAQGRPAQVEVKIDENLPAVPELVAGNLLLMSQEALHNALKHGRPGTVELIARGDGAGLELTIRDDGVGFTPGEEEGPAQGHFGLAGMKERVDRLGGSLQIESAPGRGTTVRAQVPLEAEDR